ncbi:hypothetical protein [Austwickia chelonae]|nr:hypothetical protein [Austwickia chelonae]
MTVPSHVLRLLGECARKHARTKLFFVGRGGQRARGNAISQH